MPLFRKSRASQINEMGPGDVLLAASGTLSQVEAQRMVQQAVLDDDLMVASVRLYDSLSAAQSDQIMEIGKEALLLCQNAVIKPEGVKPVLLAACAHRMLEGCREVLGVSSSDKARDQEHLLAVVTVRGAARMFELRRPQQAARALGYGLGLVLYFTAETYGVISDQVSGMSRRHRATWRTNGVTIEISTDGPTLRFDSEPDPYFDQIYAEAALAQMEAAYGMDPSFPNAEKTLISLFAPKSDADEGVEHTDVRLVFYWDPPLPRSD